MLYKINLNEVRHGVNPLRWQEYSLVLKWPHKNQLYVSRNGKAYSKSKHNTTGAIRS